MLGSRKPLNRSHIPGTLDACAFRDRLQCAGVLQAFVQPPRARSGLEAAGARDCTNDCSRPLVSWRHLERPRQYAVYVHQVVLVLTPACRARWEKRPRWQADDAADDRWANICPAWRQSV